MSTLFFVVRKRLRSVPPSILVPSSKRQIENKQPHNFESLNPYSHVPLDFSSLREDVVESDGSIASYFADQQEQQQHRIIDQHFIVPKLKTDGGFV
jgi:hypothetical protein